MIRLLRLLSVFFLVSFNISLYANHAIAHQLTVRYLSDVDPVSSALMDIEIHLKLGHFYDCGHGCNESRCIYQHGKELILAEKQSIDKFTGYIFDFSEKYLFNRFFSKFASQSEQVFDCGLIFVVEGEKAYDYDIMFSYNFAARKFDYFSPPATEQFMN